MMSSELLVSACGGLSSVVTEGDCFIYLNVGSEAEHFICFIVNREDGNVIYLTESGLTCISRQAVKVTA